MLPPTSTRRLIALVACLLAAAPIAAVVAAPAGAPEPQPLSVARAGAGPPACFGAAARDALRPCSNPALRRSVTPLPAAAARSPNASCRAVEQYGLVRACYFGVPREQAHETVALVGDSHASHWRAALEQVALARRWEGISLARTSCPLAKAVRDVPEPKRSQCARWNHEVLRWFARHPEVRTVFTGQLSGGKGVVAPAGVGKLAARVSGFVRSWRALPATVRRVVVIRDTPKARPRGGVANCVSRAIARRRDAAVACASPRRGSLDRDPAAAATRRVRSPDARVVDMTDLFCDARRCFPVIGGALAYKDSNHLTRVFVESAGPLLERRLAALERRRPPATARRSAAPAPVPVLTYHHVARTRPFRRQMAALSRAGYRAVTLARVWSAWHGGPPLPGRPLVVTLDDGYADQYVHAAPVLGAFGWPAVVNLTVGWLDRAGHLSSRQVSRLTARGWQVAAHTLTHPDLRRLGDRRLAREVTGARTALERRFGAPVRFFSYPHGRWDARVRAAVRAAGFLAATTIRPGAVAPWDDPLTMRRIHVEPQMPPRTLLQRLAAARREALERKRR